jgi:metal-responsive CopG/Arc/MetJ family transcriptional regulator
MARTIIDLPVSQLRDLDALCASLDISRAEAVRRAVQAFLLSRADREETCFGRWGRNDADTSDKDSAT